MKKLLLFMSVLLLAACSDRPVNYDGAPLKIAVIGEVPDLYSDKVSFEQIELEEFSGIDLESSSEFDAVMVTPSEFEGASDDRFADVYRNSKIPVIFFNSPKRHFPFVNEEVTYETAHWEVLNNGSHTTVYLHTFLPDSMESKEDAWYFYLKDEKMLNELYREILQKIEEL